MEYALMTEPQLGMTYETLLDLARFADELGLAAFSRSDHYSFDGVDAPHATDAFATLGGLARETSNVELVVLVSPITFRHPGVIAKMAATIDEMSGGRLALGVGTGWMELEHQNFGLGFPDLGERFDRLEESLAYLHHAFGRREGEFEGEYYSLKASDVRPLPTGSMPIIVGGSGERKTPRLAGTYADEYNMGIRPPEAMKLRFDRAREAAEKAGRDPDDLRLSVMTAVIGGMDEAGFRRQLAAIAAADPFGRDADALESRYRERGLPIGTSEEVREVIAGLEAIGVSRIYVQHFGPYDREVIGEVFEALGA